MNTYQAEFIPADNFSPSIIHKIEAEDTSDALAKFKQIAQLWKGEFINIEFIEKCID